MKTEREIEATEDWTRALDEEQKKIALGVLLEEMGLDLEKLQGEICDGCCHWAQVCATQEKLNGYCARCRISGLWDRMFGKAAG